KRNHTDRPYGLYEGADFGQCLCDLGRGPEYYPCPNENVPDPDGEERKIFDQWGSGADRFAQTLCFGIKGGTIGTAEHRWNRDHLPGRQGRDQTSIGKKGNRGL